ncbi:MAG: DUF4339 domain-containing protein [Verrucomicrobia bacterium]|nr:DUF4339 domain-containing protein [Verrucomicrobiota bacterium]
MYYIQGADQKEYGPVSSDQLRQWISENRLNRFSPARADGESLWKTLGDFPEFADVLGASASPTAATPPSAPPAVSAAHASPYGSGFRPSTPGISESVIDEKIKVPAIGIITTGALGALFSLTGVITTLSGSNKNTELPPGLPPEAADLLKSYLLAMEPFNLPLNLLALILSALTLMAGIKMLHRRSYGLVMAGVIVGMIPCLSGCCCTGLPFGIWALVVLSNAEVRKSFH